MQKVTAQPDTLHLEFCYEQARELSPLKQQELLNKSIYELSLQNHQSNYYPSLSLNGKASYQSEVISIPGTGAFPDYPQIPKEQFQVSIDINQNIYDGGLTKISKRWEESKWKLNEYELETELYSIHTIINDLYFTILQLQENRNILNTTIENLTNQKDLIRTRVQEGVILENNLYQIEKQILTLEQEIISVESDKDGLAQVLSEWIGQPIISNTLLTIPEFPGMERPILIQRPENEFFHAQRSVLESQMSLSHVERRPKFSAFAQGGIGQPNPMNFFEVDPSTYYLLGVRLNWPIYDWGNVSRKNQIYSLQQDMISTREANFNRNMNMTLTRLYAELNKLEEVIKKDNEIIALQEKIVKTVFAEFQNGVITSTEYLTELNMLTEAEIKRSLHKIQVANTYVKIYTTSGQEF
jgi:outer membrane protein TolC